MASPKAFTDVAIAAGGGYTTINTDGASPCSIENASDTPIVLRAGGSGDTRTLLPGQRVEKVPAGAIIAGAHGGSGNKNVQVIRTLIPGELSAVAGGSVGAAGSVAAGGHRGLWSTLQGDFTTVYASATTLTLGTFPTAMGTPEDENFVMVVVTNSAGVQRTYFPTVNAMTLSGQVLTVVGATFDATDLGYDVFAWGPPKGYDASINGDQVRVLNPNWLQLLQVTLVDATNVTDGTVYYPFTFTGYKYGSLRPALDCGAGTVTATLEASLEADATESTATYDDVMTTLGFTPIVAAAAPASGLWIIDTPLPIVYGRLKVVYATGANTGDATAWFKGMY